MSYTLQFTKTLILLAGYINIQNANISGCLVFCRQDEKCTSFVYSELAPPFKGSYCSFYSNTFVLGLKVPEKNSSTGQSYLIILESGEKDPSKNVYVNALLNGNYFLRINQLIGKTSEVVGCDTLCLRNPFCDAVDFISSSKSIDCFFYSRQDIINITYTDDEDAGTQLFI